VKILLVGACGIACETCKKLLNKTCIIDGCSQGTNAAEKLEKQRKTLGFTCPILECAFKNGVSYCMRDCKNFPCKIYYESDFPYSKKFLDIMRM